MQRLWPLAFAFIVLAAAPQARAQAPVPELGDVFPFSGGNWGNATLLPADRSQSNPYLTGAISTATDRDYYVVTSPQASGCRLYFDVQISGGADLDIYVYDIYGAYVGSSTGTTNYERVLVYPPASGGVYVLEVYGYYGATAGYAPMTFYDLCSP